MGREDRVKVRMHGAWDQQTANESLAAAEGERGRHRAFRRHAAVSLSDGPDRRGRAWMLRVVFGFVATAVTLAGFWGDLARTSARRQGQRAA